MIRFDPKSYEDSIAAAWEQEGTYRTPELTEPQNKEYIVGMFPYPSGDGLHTGHARIYTGSDILARFYRMNGKTVLFPMGWDAFGLPAENAAIKTKRAPQEMVPGNIDNFRRQFKALGISYDWEREVNSTDPDYYAVTQWLFIEFFKHGLLYKKDTQVDYCPNCKTGLALEEVTPDGTHERCGTPVEKRSLPQWIFRITEYAESLLQSLKGLDWPSGILEQQKNWIGKKEGVTFSHKVKGTDYTLETFTAYPGWSYADSFIVVAPEHPFVEIAIREGHVDNLEKVVQGMRTLKSEERAKSKEGIFTGFYAQDPLGGEDMPIWVANFALMDFGTGAIRCSIHDIRDREFAQKYGIPVRAVVEAGPDGKPIEAHVEKGLLVNSGPFTGKRLEDVKEEMVAYFVEQGFGKKHVNYHLRDWIFSRQRYWGEPIPMIFCQDCADKKVSYWDDAGKDLKTLGLKRASGDKTFGDMVEEVKEKMYGWFPISAEELPLKLPLVESYEPTESGESPLSQIPEWVSVVCPVCGGKARRETDTMPNWAGSCWYFLAYPMAAELRNSKPGELMESKAWEAWMPIDWYVGGAEHAVLHLLYARFWMHVLNDWGSVKFREPFTRLRNVGMVQAPDGRKMSKSLGNVINPNDAVAEYGADTLRVYEMFMAPFNQETVWSVQTMQGAHRFLSRIWRIYMNSAKITESQNSGSKKLVSELQTLIQKITQDIPDVKFNTPIAGMMEFVNSWEASSEPLFMAYAQDFLKLLAPFAPYMTDYVWRNVCKMSGSIHNAPWPKADESLILSENITLPVQIAGKVRDTISISADLPEEEVIARALKSENVSRWIGDTKYKTIYVKGKILSVILEE